MDLGIGTIIILVVIVLHLIGGFAFLIYKLSPRPGDKIETIYDDADDENHDHNFV